MKRRVAITGVGAMSPYGAGYAAFAEGSFAGRSGVAARDYGQFRMPVAEVAVRDEDLQGLGAASTFGAPRSVRLGIVAARQAFGEAFPDGMSDDQRKAIGVFMGSGSAAVATICQTFPGFELSGEVPPYALLAALPSGPATYVALDNRLGGACRCVSAACASGLVAVAQAFSAIADGSLDGAIAGGAESPLFKGEVASWRALRALAPVDADDPAQSCRPFDVARKGLVLGEGAAVFYLEPLETARKRGARIYAEIVSVGESCDATHMTRPDAAGQARCMNAALKGGLVDDIDLVVAHGTGTPPGDLCEAEAIGAVFAERRGSIKVVSNKGLVGHTLGASGGFNLLTALMAVSEGRWSGSFNVSQVDERLGFDCLPNRSVEGPCRAALVNSFAFGGSNCSMVVAQVA